MEEFNGGNLTLKPKKWHWNGLKAYGFFKYVCFKTNEKTSPQTYVPASGKFPSPQSGLMDYLASRVKGWVKGVNSDFTCCEQLPPNAATFSGNSGSNL